MVTKKAEKEPRVIVTLSMPYSLLQSVKKLVRKRKTNRSAFMRGLLEREVMKTAES